MGAVEATPGQVFAASPQFWTPPPRPIRDTLVPVSEGAGTQPPLTDGPEHTPTAASPEGPVPQMAVSPPDLHPTEGHGGIPSGEIIQWTGFSGSAETASRLAD